MDIRSAYANRGQYPDDGKRLAGIIDGIVDRGCTDPANNHLLALVVKIHDSDPATTSTVELSDAYVTATTVPLRGSGSTWRELELTPKDPTIDGLGVTMHDSTITEVSGLRPNITGDLTSGRRSSQLFSRLGAAPIDAVLYGASDAPAVVDDFFSKFGKL